MRWILRQHGVRLAGPRPDELVDEVPEQAVRDEAHGALPHLLDDVRSWADMDNAWTQRYLVQTCCRVLFTWRTGRVCSKPVGLAWAQHALDPAWRPLLAQVAADRGLPWHPVDPPRPGGMDLAVRFAEHVRELAEQP